MVWLDGMSRLRLTALMPSLFTGTVLKKKEAHYSTCQQFEFRMEDNAIVETDGENIGTPPVKYTILPKAIQVII